MPIIRSTGLRLLLPVFVVAIHGTDLNRSNINSTCFDPITATWCAGAAGSALVGALWSQLEGTGFRCCCDSDVKPESGTLCRYITPKNNGKCPRADLGRGWTQTHSAQRNHGVLNPDKCILTGKEEIPRLPASIERMQCNAQEEMDAKVFPPEDAGDWAIRMAFAQVPAIGNLFVGIEDIQLTEVDMTIKLKRKSDDTFSFEVAGPDGIGNAVVKAWIQGIHFQLPESNADSVVKALSKMEAIGGQIFSFGQAKNYGKIDVSPADAQFKMKADFRISKKGQWEIVPESDSQWASVNLGNGGMLSGMLNLVIKHLGGMDKIFFDVVWPLIKELFPTSVGEAFQQVPFENGRMEHNLKVSGHCKRTDATKNTDTRQCPSHLFTVDIRDSTTLRFRPRKIVESLSELGFFQDGSFLDAFAKNTIKAYDRGEHALDGTMFKGHLGVRVNPGTGLTITGTPLVELPYDVLSRILGTGVEFGDFIGKAGVLEAAGSGSMNKGVFSAKGLSLTGLALPVGDAGSIEVSATLDDLEIVVEDNQAPESDLIFAENSPLTVNAPGLDLSLGAAEGLVVKPLSNLEGVGWKVALDPAYLDEVFKNITKRMLTPGSVRTKPEEKADGVVPKRFRRPHAFMKQPLDISSVLQDLDIDTELEMGTEKATQNDFDLIDVNLGFTIIGELSLPPSLFRSLTNSKDKDYGYLHFSLPGYYGEFGSRGQFEGTPAVAVLNCGSLWLYNADKLETKQKPFQKVIKALDIGDAENQKILSLIKVDQAFSCLQVEIDSAFIGLGTVRKFFCTDEDNFKLLNEAMALQLKRISDANKRWPGQCYPGPNGNAPTCLGNPDGTWFTRSNPLDLTTWFPAMEPPESPAEVSSPRDQWKAALRSLLS